MLAGREIDNTPTKRSWDYTAVRKTTGSIRFHSCGPGRGLIRTGTEEPKPVICISTPGQRYRSKGRRSDRSEAPMASWETMRCRQISARSCARPISKPARRQRRSATQTAEATA